MGVEAALAGHRQRACEIALGGAHAGRVLELARRQLEPQAEGLAPLVRQEIWNCLSQLKRLGQTIIVIDKNIGPLLRLADSHHLVEKGRVVWSGSSDSLRARGELLHKYLGVQ